MVTPSGGSELYSNAGCAALVTMLMAFRLVVLPTLVVLLLLLLLLVLLLVEV